MTNDELEKELKELKKYVEEIIIHNDDGFVRVYTLIDKHTEHLRIIHERLDILRKLVDKILGI